MKRIDVTNKQATEICDRIANGESVRNVLADCRLDWPRWDRWLSAHEDNATRYARALAARTELQANEIEDIADEVRDATDPVAVQAAKLRIETRRWLMGKRMPKKYGEALDVKHSGAVNLTITADDASVL